MTKLDPCSIQRPSDLSIGHSMKSPDSTQTSLVALIQLDTHGFKGVGEGSEGSRSL